MCGIAGAVDLTGNRVFPAQRLLAMTGALAHRGPDDEQVHVEPGVALGVRRLSVIDVAGGRQPLANETGDVWVAYEGELFEYPELRKALLDRGHKLATSCDTEAWVHLYEDQGDAVFNDAHGQFAVSLWDRKDGKLLLGRDRVGISPLFYARADGWLIWASEAKALFASGLIAPEPDRRGIDYFFNFYALPNTRTCFKGVQSIPPGHFLRIRGGNVQQHKYWDLDFPDAGDERRFARPEDAAKEYEEILRGAVRRRLVGEVPLGCYISGGLDSTTILGLSTQELGRPVPSFTIKLNGSGPSDEEPQAIESARFLDSPLTSVSMRSRDIADAYPELIRAAEGPVFDTSAACMIRLAHEVRKSGITVSLTGEGADESLAGYAWFKADLFVRMTGQPLNNFFRRRVFSHIAGGGQHLPPYRALHGVRPAQQVTYELMAQSREPLYSQSMWTSLGDYTPYDEVPINADRIKHWHPLNQSLYTAHKVMLSGMLLAAKGDRSLRNGSTEGRFPFLDERVVEFCTQLPPNYKLRGMKDKWLLRQVASRALPRPISRRPKTMFIANFSGTFLGDDRPAWVDQLLSEESLQASGYFDAAAVRAGREIRRRSRKLSLRGLMYDMGLTGVIATQLFHHTYFGGGLADLPQWTPPSVAETAVVQ